MSNNIPLGTHFSDGVRSGPIYSSQLINGSVADINGVITSSDYSTYGPGSLLSCQNSYNITPAPPSTAAGNTILNNIVATTAPGAVPGATKLTLRGDNSSTYYTVGQNGFPLIQLDWPRVITATIAGEDAQEDTRLTIFGFDWYGFPMQQTYILGAIGTTPVITLELNAGEGEEGDIDIPVKAFYQVTEAYIDAGLPGACTISLGAADVFGLPYLVKGLGSVTAVAWATQTTVGPPNPNPIFPVTEFTPSTAGSNRITVAGVFVPGDTTFPATATTGDPRGLYGPSSPASAQTIGGVPEDYKQLIFTAYVEGLDTWINQVAAKQQQYEQQTGNPPQGVPILPLIPADAYGKPQFYTGLPS